MVSMIPNRRLKSEGLQRRLSRVFLSAFFTGAVAVSAQAGEQQYETLSASVRAAMGKAVNDRVERFDSFESPQEATTWLATMSERMKRFIPDPTVRLDFLKNVHYEALRAGLDPQLVLGLIQVESAFRRYAISSASAQGYMQVMPFWVEVLGSREHNLFNMRTNLRYGCTILRHYLDIEKGDLFRALGRYNGSLGKAEYPNLVLNAWNKHWFYPPAGGSSLATQSTRASGKIKAKKATERTDGVELDALKIKSS